MAATGRGNTISKEPIELASLTRAQLAAGASNIERAHAEDEKRNPRWGINALQTDQALRQALDSLEHLRQVCARGVVGA